MYYNSLCQLLRVLFFSWCVGGIIVLYILVSVLANHFRSLGYLLKHLPSKVNFLDLLFLFLRVLLLYFIFLLDLFKAPRYLPPIILTMLRLRFLLPKLAFIFLISIRLSSVGLVNIILR